MNNFSVNNSFIKGKLKTGLFHLVILAFSILICALIGCSSSKNNNSSTASSTEGKKELTPVTLNEVAHSIFYAPQYAAIELGYFEEEGILLTLDTGFGADKTMTALISGNADIGFMGSEASIYTYKEGNEDFAVNFAQLTQRAGNFLVSREQNDSFSWSQLKGSTVIGGRKGGMPEMVFEYILKKNGLTPQKDVTIIQNIDFGSTAAAFSSDTSLSDYTVEFEPHATLLELSGDGYVVTSLGVDSGYVPYTAYSARKSFLTAHPDTIQHFTNAIQKGLEYVNSHNAAEIANVIAPQFPETDIKTITIIVNRYLEQDTWKNDTIFTKESFDLLQDILLDAGELEQKVPYDDLVTTAYAKNAITNHK